MAEQKQKVAFFGGRNFIESIVYSLTYLEFQHRLETGEENLGFLVVELERHLCGLSRAIPPLKNIYHNFVKEILREMYKDYPLPELGEQCIVRNILFEWFNKNKNTLFQDSLLISLSEEIKERIENTINIILHQAIMGALYEAGVISHGK